MNEIQHWIDNQVVVSTSGRTAPVYNPALGEQSGTVALASVEEVDAAVASAKAAAPGWRETIERILYEIAGEVARLGGTLAGEHGDGRLRAPLLETIWGADMVALFREVKEAFDPAGILNPGVILPLAGQRPLDAIRDFAAQRSRVFGGEALDIPQ